MCTQSHTCTHAMNTEVRRHTYMQNTNNMCTHTDMHAHICIHVDTYVDIDIDTCTDAQIHMHTQTCTYAYT